MAAGRERPGEPRAARGQLVPHRSGAPSPAASIPPIPRTLPIAGKTSTPRSAAPGARGAAAANDRLRARLAEGPNRPSLTVAPAGTWLPQPAELGLFARALATRYSGGFVDPADPGCGRASARRATSRSGRRDNNTPNRRKVR